MAAVRTLLALLVALYGGAVPIQVCRAADGAAWTVVGAHAPDHPPVCREHGDAPCRGPDGDAGGSAGACCTDTPLDLAAPHAAPALVPLAPTAACVVRHATPTEPPGERPPARPGRPPGVEGVVLLR